jgi:hypothetical protein
VETKTAEKELKATDLCDACGAAAKVVATFLNGELFFCGHHAREAGTNLVLKALHVYDPDGEFNLLH